MRKTIINHGPTPILTPYQLHMKLMDHVGKMFASNNFVIKNLEAIINSYTFAGGDFSILMGKYHTDSILWQRKWLGKKLQNYKYHKKRVYRYDAASDEWVHLPGLLWVGTRTIGRMLSEDQLLERIEGIQQGHIVNRDGNDKEIEELNIIKQQIRDGVIFEKPEQLGLWV